MLFYGLSENQIVGHAVLNLAAGLLIGYSWMNKDNKSSSDIS